MAPAAPLSVVVRPVAVVLATWGSQFSWRERVFLGFMAPREIVAAAVSAVFALRLAENTTVDAERLFPLTFLVIVATVTDYGISAPMGARWLGVATPNPQGFLVAAPLHGSGSWPGFSVKRRFVWCWRTPTGPT